MTLIPGEIRTSSALGYARRYVVRQFNNAIRNPAIGGEAFVQLNIKPQNVDIHVSDMRTFYKCRRKHLFQTMYGLRRKYAAPSPALYTGSLYHTIRQHATISGGIAGGLFAADAIHNQTVHDLMTQVNDIGLLPGGKNWAYVLADMDDCLSKAKTMASWSYNRKPWPPPEEVDDWEILGVEQVIRARIPVIRYWARVKLDLVVRQKSTGHVWIVDYKTIGDPPAEAVKQYMFDEQPRLYTAVAHKAYEQYGGVQGFIYSVISRPTIRLKKNQSFEDYLLEIEEWYEGKGRHDDKLAARIKEPLYLLQPLHYASHLDDEMLFTLKEYKMALKARPDLPRFGRNKDACFDYNSRCPYWDLCTDDELLWPTTLADRYESVPHRDTEDQNILEVTL